MKQPKWPAVQFADILERVDRKFVLDDTETYDCVGVRWYGLGTFIRESKLGIDIRRKKQWILKEGDVVYNKLFAWKGSFAIAGTDVDGCIVSDKFPTYRLDEEQVDPRYLKCYFCTEFIAQQAQDLSKGAAAISKLTLNPPDFWKLTIPLPPLDEQRRIVARIEELATLIQEARGLRVKARQEAEALPFEALHDFISKGIVKGWALRPLSEVCEVNPSRKGRTNYPDDMQVSFVPMSAVDAITGSIAWPEVRSFSEVKRGYKWFLEGDVIFARITPCMQNGKSAIAKVLVNGVGFGSTEFHVLRPGEKVSAEWIHCIVRQPSFRRDAVASFKGSAGQQRVPRAFLEEYEVPVPTLDEQRRIVAYLHDLQAQVDELTALQDATQAELDALLPSVLDRAFRGEL